MTKVRFKKGYKYQICSDFDIFVDIFPGENIDVEFISLQTDGLLTIKSGYASDGPSGPTIDTKNFMRGAFVHDALYQLIRMEKLSLSHRKQADKELRKICREDGMTWIRAWWVYKAVRFGGKDSALPENKKKVLIAP